MVYIPSLLLEVTCVCNVIAYSGFILVEYNVFAIVDQFLTQKFFSIDILGYSRITWPLFGSPERMREMKANCLMLGGKTIQRFMLMNKWVSALDFLGLLGQIWAQIGPTLNPKA